MGPPGATVLLLRAVVVHPAGCESPSPCHGETTVAFEEHDPLGIRDDMVLAAAFPTAHSLAHLRIVPGYFVEYSGTKFGIFLVGEHIEFAFANALMVTLFLGAYHLLFLHADGLHVAFGDTVPFDMKMSHLAVSVIHVIALSGKTILFTWFQVFIRWTLPRFRYDPRPW